MSDQTHRDTNPPDTSTTDSHATAWSPLRFPVFRALWIAAVASNFGTWMQSVGAVWLMTSLSPSPLLIALVQTATSLPIFLLALPAGALADVMDRRRLLLFSQTWMLAAAAGLGVLTLLGGVGAWTLLAFTFLLGLGGALNGPAWQAIVPELVPGSELPAAITLNGAGFNLARAAGPALGGLVVALAGPAAVFLLNAASFVGVLWVLYHWRRAPRHTFSPAERVLGAMRAGARYARHSPELLVVLYRTACFILGASAIWALLPVLAARELHLSSSGYGSLLAALGIGAVIGALALPAIRARISTNALVTAGSLIFGLVTLALVWLRSPVLVWIALLPGGLAWMAVMSTLNVSAQTSVPEWVQARALGIYALIFQGGMALASALWGAAASHFGLSMALLGGGAALFLSLLAGVRFRLVETTDLNFAQSPHWPEPVVVLNPHPDRGPVLVTARYQIDPAMEAAFELAMNEVALARRRGGAMRWGLFRDIASPGSYVETFLVESWAEHLRQHERVNMMDRVVEDAARVYQVDGIPVIVEHLIAVESPDVAAVENLASNAVEMGSASTELVGGEPEPAP